MNSEPEKTNVILGKKYRIEIRKDNQKLVYHGTIMELTPDQIMFIDKFGVIYSFNRALIQEMQSVRNAE